MPYLTSSSLETVFSSPHRDPERSPSRPSRPSSHRSDSRELPWMPSGRLRRRRRSCRPSRSRPADQWPASPRPAWPSASAAPPPPWGRSKRLPEHGDKNHKIYHEQLDHFVLEVDWVRLTWSLSVPLFARFCLGWWEFGRNG